MAKATHVNVNGTWKEVKNVWENVGGVWKEKVVPFLNVGGFNKECMSYISERIFLKKGNNLMEVDIENFASLNSITPGETLYAVGGIEKRLYVGGRVSSYPYGLRAEVSPEYGTILNQVIKFRDPEGMGGKFNELYMSDNNYTMYQLNPDTFATINSAGFDSSSKSYSDVGATINYLFQAYLDLNPSPAVYKTREINSDTLATIRTVTASYKTYGVGGINEKIFFRS